MLNLLTRVTLPIAFMLSGNVLAGSLTLTSDDISQGKYLKNAQVFQGFGCQGENLSPQLSWTGAPEGTKALAVLVHDPDAPTGSGWWHWQVVNIPKEVNSLPAGAGDPKKNLTPAGITNIKNDFGVIGFGGACPPKGHGTHRYMFTLHALSQTLDLPEDASGALTGYMVHANTIESSTIEALYKRD